MTSPNPKAGMQGRSFHLWLLALASGTLLGAAFPPSPFHALAYVCLVPLLVLLESTESLWKQLRMSYVAFFVFHVITLYWTGGFVVGKDPWMMGAGAALLIVHPLFYVLVIALYLLVNRRRGLNTALLALPFLWIAFEYSHSLGEFSFPWVTLGNSQAYDLSRIQIAEYTSVYGVSMLILVFNCLGFLFVSRIATGRWGLQSVGTRFIGGLLIIIYIVPWMYGKWMMAGIKDEPLRQTLRVAIVQPNIDPWEKWSTSGQSRWASFDHQLQLLLTSTQNLAGSNPDLVIWPETAIPFRILLPQHGVYLGWLRGRLDTVNVALLTGLPSTVFYDSSRAPITASKDEDRRIYYDDFNSATLFLPGQPTGPIYRKIVLVPFAERIPYAETFRFLIEPLKWNVGIGMWGIGKDTVVFKIPLKSGVVAPFSSMICYESVYPNYVREFVRRGAQFLVIITNDSWWGNTPGAYQHASYASFRAIETRRWIARAANGGISGVVGPDGSLHDATKLYSSAAFVSSIALKDGETFYVRHGDLFALACTILTAAFLLFALVPKRKS